MNRVTRRKDRQALIFALRSMTVAGKAAGEPTYDMAGDWARLKGQLNATAPQARPSRSWVRYAAIGVAASLIAIAIPQIITHKPTQAPAREYITERGQRAVMDLADGSTVTLGPASRLKVTGRTVELEGEALFSVVPSSKDPFKVIAGGVSTVVLGTTFAVRTYNVPNAQVQIAVKGGRVSVGDDVLGAGDVALVSSGKRVILRSQKLSQYMDWAEGRLVFSNTPVPVVVEELSRWYDVKIQLGSPELARSHFTASFKDEPLEFVLNSLNVTLGARYERADNRVTFLKKN